MTSVTDVVCGVDIPEDQAEDLGAVRVDHDGETYWFCCPTCAETFRKNPDRFVGRDVQAEGHSH